MASVQFHNSDDVLKAFQDRNAKAWSVWQHKQFMFKGVGDDELQNVLELLSNGATNAIYTVKVYDDIDDQKNIKSNTPDDGSFNFRLNGENMTMHGHYQGIGTKQSQLEKKVEDLTKQLQERDEEPDEERTIGKVVGDVVMDALSDPAKMVVWIDLFKSIWTNKPAAPAALRSLPYQAPPAAVGNIQDVNREMTVEEMQRVSVALGILEKKDAKVVEHMEKLARMAEKNPSQFKFILGMLDTIVV